MLDYDAIEADLISASAHGMPALAAEVCKKVAALQLSAEDRAVAVDELGVKAAGLGKALLTGASMLAGPAFTAVQHMAGRKDRELTRNTVMQLHPEIFAKDPHRASAMLDLIDSAAPNLMKNPIVVGDLVRQLTSVPSLDLGTVSGLAGVGKAMAAGKGGGDFADKMVASVGRFKPIVDGLSDIGGGVAEHFKGDKKDTKGGGTERNGTQREGGGDRKRLRAPPHDEVSQEAAGGANTADAVLA